MSFIQDLDSRLVRIFVSLLLAAGLLSATLNTAPAEALSGNTRVVCADQVSANTIGVEVPADGQTHVFARYKKWTGSTWATIYQSPVNLLPQSVSNGQFIQVSTFYLPGFMISVGAGHFKVDVYSYYTGSGWHLHSPIYQWNNLPLQTKYCTMG